jgi:hypothetical protein
MATSLKLRRGTTAQHASFTGSAAEVTVDTDKNTVVVHNGSTAGGFSLVRNGGNENVGIGTSSPAGRLEVKSPNTSRWWLEDDSSATNTKIVFAASNGSVSRARYQALEHYWQTGNVIDAAILNSSGNLGLGVTPSAWAGFLTALDLNGNGSISGGLTLTTAGIFIGSNNYYNSGFKYKISGQRASYYGQADGTHTWHTAASGTAGNAITFTQAMTLNANGNLALQGGSTSATGVGITFPSSQSASTDSNCLDDYEEGTWTPQFGFNSINSTGVTYGATNAGYYTKVGRLVTVTFLLEVSNKGSASGNGIIGGFPFSCINNQGARGGVALGYTGSLTVNNPNLMLDAGSSFMVFRIPNGGDMNQTTFSTAFAVYASYSYFTT